MFIKAEDLDTPEGRKGLVTRLNEAVSAHKSVHRKAIQRMKENQRMVRRGGNRMWKRTSYVVNVTQRHIKKKTAEIYAKNPRMAAKRKPRLWYELWDGNPETLQAATDAVTQAAAEGLTPDSPEFPRLQAEILEEYLQVQEKQQQLDRIGKTLEILFHYYTDELQPPFKTQMKQLVRRALTNTVGYVKLGYQRELGKRPETQDAINDVRGRLGRMERIAQEVAQGDVDEDGPDAAELELSLEALKNEESVVIRQGLVMSFPKSTQIVPDLNCSQLTGFVNCQMLTHEMYLTSDQVKEIYGIELAASDYRAYEYRKDREWQPFTTREHRVPSDQKQDSHLCLREIYHKPSGLMYTVVDGFTDFLEEPGPPHVVVETFFPIEALCFTEQEDEEELFPPADVELMEHQQMDMNRARESRRQHRTAARPGWAAPTGALEEEDKENLKNRNNMDVIELANLLPGSGVQDLLQPIPMPGIDMNLYEISTTFDDLQLVVGAQEATLGGISGATATETSIAEGSRVTSEKSETDDMNEFLSRLARGAGQILMAETPRDEAIRIAGPGAVWPELTTQEIQEELFLDLAAGSNGPPNAGAQLVTLERVLPLMLQIPGFSPDWLRTITARLVDDTFDANEAFEPTMPSIVQMNDARRAMTGDPATEPTQQGPQGGSAARAPGTEQGPTPGAPALVAGTEVRG